MSKQQRTISIIIVTMLLLGAFAGCSRPEEVEIHNPGTYATPQADALIDLSLEMIPLTEIPAIFYIPMPEASGTSVRRNSKAEIDYSNSKDGYVMVRFRENTSKQLRVLITGPSGNRYTYHLKANNVWEVFPFSDGIGNYTVGVFEQIEGTRYAQTLSSTIRVTLDDEFAPFLRPNQYVNFTRESNVVAKANELMEDVEGWYSQVSVIYNFIMDHLSYDRALAASVQSGYLPDLDDVLAREKGICFDYAALMTAMLRSQSIPTRLVVGYAGTAYHAWISVYTPEEGWIDSVIYFNGEQWNLMDPTFADTGNRSASVMRFIGDGTNYTAKFLY